MDGSIEFARLRQRDRPHLIHASLSSLEPTTQTASRAVQPFLQGSRLRQTDRPTDHATSSVTINRLHLLRRGLVIIGGKIKNVET